MNLALKAVSVLLLVVLFWYGFTYSLTDAAFAVQGWLGALIPSLTGAWLFGAGWFIGRPS